jgi:hypothetical protein
LFLLHKGSLRIERPGTDEVLLQATNVIGVEILQHRSSYGFSCVVNDDDTQLCAFDRDAISQLSNESRGGILMMALKSVSQLDQSFGEHKKIRLPFLRQRTSPCKEL